MTTDQREKLSSSVQNVTAEASAKSSPVYLFEHKSEKTTKKGCSQGFYGQLLTQAGLRSQLKKMQKQLKIIFRKK